MAMLPCDWCQKFGHAWFQCPDPKRPANWKPSRLRRGPTVKAVVAAKAILDAAPVPKRAKVLSHDLTDPAQVDALRRQLADMEKPKVGRPRIHADRKAYKAEKERERRAAAREAKK